MRQRLTRFEDVHEAEDVHPRPERRICAAGRNLQRREVDHVRRPPLLDQLLDRALVRDVDLFDVEGTELALREQVAQPLR